MKHAYLIEAHNNFEQLLELLKNLDYSRNDIYLHIDKKSIIPDYILKYKGNKSNVFILDKRIDVQWGSSSQIVAELLLIEEAVKNGNYIRFHLISGVDVPIKSQEAIHSFFDKNKNKEFVHIDNHYNKKEIYKRVKYYYPFIDKYGRSNKLLNIIQNCFIAIQKITFVNRVRKSKIKFYKGSNWFSITDDFAKFVLEQKKSIIELYKNTKCCDEVFLQTILMNSKYKDNLYYDKENNKYSNMRYIDWKRGNPYIFRESDFTELINNNCMFARKFDINIDKSIIEKIYKHNRSDLNE